MFNKTPTKGMRDILPQDCELRDEIMKQIKTVYSSYGFSSIETPCVEDIKLLTGKDGGENTKLMYRILKRGEKLNESNLTDLCDLGLRFDLTLSLTRFYANNAGSLPTVFKAMQIGNVWRADRPQKGRYRQFVQCDIDIIGEKSNLAECELISATSEALKSLDFVDFTVRVNDRRILSALAKTAGFDGSNQDEVFIILDKLDKIGTEGVLKELSEINEQSAKSLIEIVSEIRNSENGLERAKELLNDATEGIQNLSEILEVTAFNKVNAKFDITLVRGMNYYTGTIFEVEMNGVGYSLAGGGRYDELLGKYTGTNIPACGFSIGFERISELIAERKRGVKKAKGGVAYIVDKNATVSEVKQIFAMASVARTDRRASVFRKAKNFRAQTESLKIQGYDYACLIEGNVYRRIDL